MMAPLARWLVRLTRYGLCAVALLLLYYSVSWYDRITLAEPDRPRVRLIEQVDETTFIVLRDGRRERLAAEQVVFVEQAGERVPDIRPGIASVVRRVRVGTALVAILLFAPVPFLVGIRLVWMLAIQDVRLSYWNAIKLTFAGNFFNFALPGMTGGDLIKAYYVSRYTHRKTEAVTTIFLDRVVGLMGLMLLATVMFIFAWKRVEWDAAYRNSLAATLALVWGSLLLGATIVFSRRLRYLARLPNLAARLPAGEQILRIGRATVAMRARKSLVIASLMNTLVLQLLVLISAYVMSRALGMRGSFALYFICVPIGFLIAAVPISPPQAFGVMEYAYILFFAQGGLNPKSAAVTFALANRLIQLVWALPGVLVPLLGAHLPSRAELEELESSGEAAEAGVRPPQGEPAGAGGRAGDAGLGTATRS